MRPRKRYTREERERWLGRLETSGKSAAAFSRAHGIGYQALLGWRRASAAAGAASGAGRGAAGRDEKLQFVELCAAGAGGAARIAGAVAAELELPGGIVVRIFAPPAPARSPR